MKPMQAPRPGRAAADDAPGSDPEPPSTRLDDRAA